MEHIMTFRSLLAIIERHNLKPDETGNYHITEQMIAEARALDEARGEKIPPPEHLDVTNGEWEPVDSDS